MRKGILKFHEKEQAFVTRLIKNRESILTFLTYKNVPPVHLPLFVFKPFATMFTFFRYGCYFFTAIRTSFGVYS